jgi:predicted metal-dependent HD superfamily phosphohydrolase
MSDLAASWQRAWHALGAEPGGPTSAASAALRDELVACYAEPHRSYHTLQHLRECVAGVEEVLALAGRPGEVELALWFHDAVYDVKAHDNEARSAAWAKEAVLGAGAPAEAARRVHALVMATRHDAIPASADGRLVVDVDLSILGADAGRFDEYETQVRREYAWVADDQFRARRREVLQRLLARPSIYGTAQIRDRLEQRARANLRRSLLQLES